MSRRKLPKASTCGTCTACCGPCGMHADVFEHGARCENLTERGCGIYSRRPEVCAGFECHWSMSRKDGRFKALPTRLRPDRTGFFARVQTHQTFPGVGLGFAQSQSAPFSAQATAEVLAHALRAFNGSLRHVTFTATACDRPFGITLSPAHFAFHGEDFDGLARQVVIEFVRSVLMEVGAGSESATAMGDWVKSADALEFIRWAKGAA